MRWRTKFETWFGFSIARRIRMGAPTPASSFSGPVPRIQGRLPQPSMTRCQSKGHRLAPDVSWILGTGPENDGHVNGRSSSGEGAENRREKRRLDGGVSAVSHPSPVTGATTFVSRPLPILFAILAFASLAACEQQSMETQPKLKTYSTASAFRDDAAARAIPAGTVSRDAPARIAALTQRPRVDEALLRRGREQYEIYCTPCHGLAGHGDGIIVERGFPQPPSYMEPRLLAADPQHFVDVITDGWGVMYPYAARVEPRDRWAIAAYIRALQVASTGAPRDVAATGAADGIAGTAEAMSVDATNADRGTSGSRKDVP